MVQYAGPSVRPGFDRGRGLRGHLVDGEPSFFRWRGVHWGLDCGKEKLSRKSLWPVNSWTGFVSLSFRESGKPGLFHLSGPHR